MEIGDRVMGAALARGIDPDQRGDLGPLAREADRLADELLGVGGLGRDLARDAHQVFLVLDQAQADLLLGDLGVALDGFLLAVELLVSQIPESQDDREEEEQHRDQWPQGCIAVLAGGRLAPPPAVGQAAQPVDDRATGQRGRIQCGHCGIINGVSSSRHSMIL
jgi:hypothetical protein